MLWPRQNPDLTTVVSVWDNIKREMTLWPHESTQKVQQTTCQEKLCANEVTGNCFDCLDNSICMFKTCSPTCSNSNSRPACLSCWQAVLKQQVTRLCSDNQAAKTSLSKSVLSESNANTQLESEPNTALPFLLFFSLSPFMLFFVLHSLLQFLKAETALWETDQHWVHMHTTRRTHTLCEFSLCRRRRKCSFRSVSVQIKLVAALQAFEAIEN